jgi:hypothetical protein
VWTTWYSVSRWVVWRARGLRAQGVLPGFAVSDEPGVEG